MATEIAKFLRKLRIDNDQSLGDMADKIGLSAAYLSAIENKHREVPEDIKEKLYKAYNLTEGQKFEFARLVAESRQKVVIGLSAIQDKELLPEYVDTAVMFAHDLSQMNREQLAEIKDCLQRIKSEAVPM
ncbi:MAG: helix-turn-helix transcriptional regulator [Treponema sp.]|nr:helix-turn-helix transcriptional regulator [Treponema sp.]